METANHQGARLVASKFRFDGKVMHWSNIPIAWQH